MTYEIAVLLASEGEPNPLLPHLSELIVGTIAFVLLFLFLRAKVFPVFERTFAERRDAIEGGMERAQAAEEEAKETLAQYREQLADARHEAARLREDAREQGAAIIAEMREQAQAEGRRLTEQAHHQIEADRVQALNQLRTQVGSLATDLAGRIVGDNYRRPAYPRPVAAPPRRRSSALASSRGSAPSATARAAFRKPCWTRATTPLPQVPGPADVSGAGQAGWGGGRRRPGRRGARVSA